MHKEIILKEPLPFEFSSKYKTFCGILGFLGLIGFVFGLKTNATRAWQAYLMAFVFFTSLSLGSLFFLSVFHLTSSQWNVNIRRVFEALVAFLPYSVVFMVILFFGGPELYKWLDPEIVASDKLLAHKAPYLNQTFFIIRTVIFFAGWLFFKHRIIGSSLKQDEEGNDSLIIKMIPSCVGFIMFFTISYSLFSVDLLMSLEPHWFSTIFGVYMFGGTMQALFASLVLLMLFIKGKGLFNGMVTLDHLHDLGKFLMGFSLFWAYIAYSQYMLIWYANLPEETIFFFHRSQGSWAIVSLALLVFKFIVPFLLLLPRWAKRTPKYIGSISVLVLIMQVVDIYWLIYPNFDDHHTRFSFYEAFIFIGFLGMFLFATFRFLSQNKLIPTKDPRIKTSAAHTVVY